MELISNVLGWLILLVIGAFLLTVAVAYMSFAPWVPIRRRDIKKIFQLANLQPGQVFYDLGCGDGRVVMRAAADRGAKAIGLEIALPFYLICKFRQLWNRNKNISFKYRNLFKEDLSQADVVYFFGIPTVLKNNRIGDKLKKELKPGAKVVSYAFSIPGWEYFAKERSVDNDLPIFLYQI